MLKPSKFGGGKHSKEINYEGCYLYVTNLLDEAEAGGRPGGVPGN